MKYLILITTCLLILSIGLKGQNHQEIESPTSDVLSLNSTGSSSTVMNFLNSNAALAGGSNKRAYISTNGNILNLGLANTNTGGRIEFFGQGQRRMTMNADGRLGLNVTPAANTLFTVESSSLLTTGHFTNSSSSSFGTAIYAESDNGIGILAEGQNYGGWFEAASQNGTALYANGYSYLEGKVRIGEDPTTADIEGQLKYNSTIDEFEGYDTKGWSPLFSSNTFLRILPTGNQNVKFGFGPHRIDFDLVEINVGGSIAGIGTYEAPISGLYEIKLYLNVEMTLPTKTEVRLSVSGSTIRKYYIYDTQFHTFSTIVELNAGEFLNFEIEKLSSSGGVTLIGSGGSPTASSSALEIIRIH